MYPLIIYLDPFSVIFSQRFIYVIAHNYNLFQFRFIINPILFDYYYQIKIFLTTTYKKSLFMIPHLLAGGSKGERSSSSFKE